MATTIYLIRPETYPASGFTNTKSLLFDGVDEYVDLGRVTMLESVSAFTLSLWVKFPSTGTAYVFGKYASGTNEIWVAKDSTERLRVDISGNGTSGSYAGGSLSTGVWYHVVVRFDGTIGTAVLRGAVYLDGTAVGNITTATTTSSFTNNSYIGALNVGNYGDAYIDEVSLFDYALNSSQVTSIYNSGTPTDLDNTSGVTAPVHWWRMGDGDTFPTITDVGTTGGNDGTMTNMESGDIQTDVP